MNSRSLRQLEPDRHDERLPRRQGLFRSMIHDNKRICLIEHLINQVYPAFSWKYDKSSILYGHQRLYNFVFIDATVIGVIMPAVICHPIFMPLTRITKKVQDIYKSNDPAGLEQSRSTVEISEPRGGQADLGRGCVMLVTDLLHVTERLFYFLLLHMKR